VIILATCLAGKPTAQEPIPNRWQRIDAGGYFSFYLPPTMQLRNLRRCLECTWGSYYTNKQIRLHAEYTSWNEEYTEEYLMKQPNYQKQITEIGGKKAKIQSWKNEHRYEYDYIAEVRFYESNGNLVARLWAFCKRQSDVDTAKQIFRTAGSFK
jgi:hypothetical protein